MKPCLGLFFAGLGRHVTLLFSFPLLRMTSWYHLPYYTAHSIFLFLFVDRRFLVRISHNKLTVIINPSNRKLVWTTIVVSLVTCSIYVSFPLTFFTLILALQLNTYTRLGSTRINCQHSRRYSTLVASTFLMVVIVCRYVGVIERLHHDLDIKFRFGGCVISLVSPSHMCT